MGTQLANKQPGHTTVSVSQENLRSSLDFYLCFGSTFTLKFKYINYFMQMPAQPIATSLTHLLWMAEFPL